MLKSHILKDDLNYGKESEFFNDKKLKQKNNINTVQWIFNPQSTMPNGLETDEARIKGILGDYFIYLFIIYFY